jgi:ribulose-5-phosphate 4-epimerase/fuculose-1-phosphate aldolase
LQTGTAMTNDPLERATKDLVIANRILAHHDLFDEYGHISVRHPAEPGRYLLARACIAAFVEPADIVEHTLDNAPVRSENRPLCSERFAHGAIYQARPDVRAVLCASSGDVATFGTTGVPLRPVLGTVGDMGSPVPVWDIADAFGGDTDLTISTPERGRSLAQALGRSRLVLTRGVGFVAIGRTLNDLIKMSVYIPKNARALAESLTVGPVRAISPGETQQRMMIDPESNAMRRGWEYWARAAGCERWL